MNYQQRRFRTNAANLFLDPAKLLVTSAYMLVLILALPIAGQAQAPQRAVLRVTRANVRSLPSTSSSVLVVATQDDTLLVLEQQSTWRRVSLKSVEGWIHGSLVREIASPTRATLAAPETVSDSLEQGERQSDSVQNEPAPSVPSASPGQDQPDPRLAGRNARDGKPGQAQQTRSSPFGLLAGVAWRSYPEGGSLRGAVVRAFVRTQIVNTPIAVRADVEVERLTPIYENVDLSDYSYTDGKILVGLEIGVRPFSELKLVGSASVGGWRLFTGSLPEAKRWAFERDAGVGVVIRDHILISAHFWSMDRGPYRLLAGWSF